MHMVVSVIAVCTIMTRDSLQKQANAAPVEGLVLELIKKKCKWLVGSSARGLTSLLNLVGPLIMY